MAMAQSGSLLWARNWKCVPCGMVRVMPGGEGGDFFAVALFAPHFALSADDVPDFFDGAVGNGGGCFSRGKFKVGHATTFEFEEYADVGSVGCGDVGFPGAGVSC